MSQSPNKQPLPNVLVHFLPIEVLQRARALAQRLQREEVFRVYVLKRIWFVLPVAFITVVGLFGIAVVAMGSFIRTLGPFTQPIRYSIAAVGMAMWMAVTVWFLYIFFSWLERRALRHTESFVERPNP